jgi:hypothetical protein
MKKDVKALLSVSLAAMNVPSTTPLVVDKDIISDTREDSDDSQSTHFNDSIPSTDGIPATTSIGMVRTLQRFVLPFSHVGLI